MYLMRKYFSVLLLLSLISAPAAHAMVMEKKEVSYGRTDVAKAGLGLLVAGGAIYGADVIAKSQRVANIADYFNYSKEDTAGVASLVGGIIGGSFVVRDSMKRTLIGSLVNVPFTVALIGLTTNRTFNKVIKRVPFVGEHVAGACSNDQCEGICNHCKVRKILMFQGVSKYVVTPFTLILENWVMNKLGMNE